MGIKIKSLTIVVTVIATSLVTGQWIVPQLFHQLPAPYLFEKLEVTPLAAFALLCSNPKGDWIFKYRSFRLATMAGLLSLFIILSLLGSAFLLSRAIHQPAW
jgi:hypothetical protein